MMSVLSFAGISGAQADGFNKNPYDTWCDQTSWEINSVVNRAVYEYTLGHLDTSIQIMENELIQVAQPRDQFYRSNTITARLAQIALEIKNKVKLSVLSNVEKKSFAIFLEKTLRHLASAATSYDRDYYIDHHCGGCRQYDRGNYSIEEFERESFNVVKGFYQLVFDTFVSHECCNYLPLGTPQLSFNAVRAALVSLSDSMVGYPWSRRYDCLRSKIYYILNNSLVCGAQDYYVYQTFMSQVSNVMEDLEYQNYCR